MKTLTYSATQYLIDDHSRTLFPLELTRLLVQHSAPALYADIKRILKTDPRKENLGFLTQSQCYASKRGLHLRRTLKLDPVAELFIYDVIYRERTRFRSTTKLTRKRYGYTFKSGRPTPATTSYGEFREAVRNAARTYRYHAGFDIARYFNSIYHHDLVFWFDNGRDRKHVEAFGRYFREIVGGRSVDCLPQGLHPCKMIGADFLRSLDGYHRVKSALMLRFMDDIFLFDDQRSIVEGDFLAIQRYLGDRGFSINAEKTEIGEGPLNEKTTIDDVKVQLLELRREALEAEYGELRSSNADEKAEETEPLTEEQIEYLKELLTGEDIDESDAELVLSVIGERAEDHVEHLVDFLERFPALARGVHSAAQYVLDKDELAAGILRIAREKHPLTEDQLFWMAKLVEEHLLDVRACSELLEALYTHHAATELSKTKVLEIPHPSLSDMRDEYLKGGRSDWLAWSSAIGSRHIAKSKRNHLLKYFGKASPMNAIVSNCVSEL